MSAPADFAFWVRTGAVLFAGSALLVTGLVGQLGDRSLRPLPASVSPPAPPDSLAAVLARCRTLTDPAQIDAACRKAWAEQRRRFFASAARPAP